MKIFFLRLVFFSTAISLLGDLGGVRITSVGWVVPLFALILCLPFQMLKPLRLKIWLPWLMFVMIEAIISTHTNAVQRAVIMVTPFLVGQVVSSFLIRPEDVQKYRFYAKYLCVVGLILVAIKVILSGGERGLFLAAESITMVALVWIFFHDYLFFRKNLALIMFAAAIAVPILSVSRTATVAAISTVVLTMVPVSRLYRIYAMLTIILLAVTVFSSSAFQEKTFVGDASASDVVASSDALQTSGRALAWEILIEQIPDELWLGHGSNSSQTVLQHKYESFDHPHNDWLRIIFEYGLVGLVLFVGTVIAQVVMLLRMAKSARSVHCRYACYTGASLFVPFLLLMITDNPLLYAAFFGNLHFMLIGMAYSLHRSELAKVQSP